jgi:hypothetical protein
MPFPGHVQHDAIAELGKQVMQGDAEPRAAGDVALVPRALGQ